MAEDQDMLSLDNANNYDDAVIKMNGKENNFIDDTGYTQGLHYQIMQDLKYKKQMMVASEKQQANPMNF